MIKITLCSKVLSARFTLNEKKPLNLYYTGIIKMDMLLSAYIHFKGKRNISSIHFLDSINHENKCEKLTNKKKIRISKLFQLCVLSVHMLYIKFLTEINL